jgi:hypothetical protein
MYKCPSTNQSTEKMDPAGGCQYIEGTRIGYGKNPPWHTNSYGSRTYRWPELTSSWVSWGKGAQQVFNAQMDQFHSLFAERAKC